jgi:hypothetical protein
MVETTTRSEAVNKIVNNQFIATIVTNTLTEVLAQELDAYAALLIDNGDVYAQAAGLRKAAQLLRIKPETDLE